MISQYDFVKCMADAVFSVPSTDDFMVRSISIQAFSLEYIEAANEKHRTLIGEGGFRSVYRGTLPDGQEVAVKVRSATSTQRTREFENEVKVFLHFFLSCHFFSMIITDVFLQIFCSCS